MRWKEIIIGAVSTLLVTIIGGIIVYTVTAEKRHETKEHLIYFLDKPTRFQSDKNEIALTTLRVANLGDAPAKEVKVAVSFTWDAIRDKMVTLSSGDTTGYTLVTDTPKLLRACLKTSERGCVADQPQHLTQPRRFLEEPVLRLVEDDTAALHCVFRQALSVSVPLLLPDEHLQFCLILTATGELTPRITVRSANTLGAPASTFTRPIPQPPRLSQVLTAVLPLSIGMLVATLGLLFMRQLRRNVNPRGTNLNNIGFVLLHQGLSERAAHLFSRAISRGDDAPHSLANYSLCLAAKGDFAGAVDYLAAADFNAVTSEEKAIIAFNRCVTALLQNDKPTAYKELRTAVGQSHSDITSYCRYSNLFAESSKDDAEIERILTNSKQSAS